MQKVESEVWKCRKERQNDGCKDAHKASNSLSEPEGEGGGAGFQGGSGGWLPRMLLSEGGPLILQKHTR